MRKILQNLSSLLFKQNNLQAPARRRKSKGQSMVEIAIALPILIILLTGMMEFGFMLNIYLSLLDSTREAARFASGTDPFITDPISGAKSDRTGFYTTSTVLVREALDPKSNPDNTSYQGRRIILDGAADDVIVTVFCFNNGTGVLYPDSGAFHLYNNVSTNLGLTNIQSSYMNGAPDAGLVLIEVFYSYHPVLGVFYNSPIMLRAHTIMPLNAADPNPVTGCP